MTPDEQQITALLDLPPADFRSLVAAHLGREESPELWGLLLHPYVVARTHEALTAKYRDVEDQLAERRAGMESFRQDCFARGAEGKAEWFTAERDYQEWRRRSLGFRRIVNARLREAKDVLSKAQPFNVKGALQNPPNAARKIRQLETVFALAWAIHEHREQCIAEDITPEPHDRELWDVLDSAEVETSYGRTTVAKYLADIMSKPGFVPPPLRDGGES